jgi:hypothetical protein
MSGTRTFAKVAVAGVKVITSLSRNCIEAEDGSCLLRRDSGVYRKLGGGWGSVRRDTLACNGKIERDTEYGVGDCSLNTEYC